MRIATDTLPDLRDDILRSEPEWQCIIDGSHNLLLEGPSDWTVAVVRSLMPLLPEPVIWARSQTLRRLPAGECGTLVLRDVGSLQRGGQARLFEWLHDRRWQVISTTTHALFPAVTAGGFDEGLYYRLNVIRICDWSRIPSDHRAP